MHRNAVVLITNKFYFPAAVFLAHKLARLNSRLDTDIILLSDWKEGIAQARTIVPKAVLIEFDFEEPDFGKLQPRALDKSAYFIFCMPRILSAYSRILYLDIDIHVASGKLFDLFDLDLGTHPIAAARGVNIMFSKRNFNSGVLLIDPEAYRVAEMETKAFDLVRSQEELPIVGRDQPVLNKLYGSDWLELSPAFNFSIRYLRTELAEAFPPELLHFIGPIKQLSTPTYIEDHPSRLELVDFLRVTPWKDFFTSFFTSSDHPHLSKWRLSNLSELDESTDSFLSFLRTARFADVEQGLTNPRLDLLEKRTG